MHVRKAMFLTAPELEFAEPFARFVDDYLHVGDTERVSKYLDGKTVFPDYVASLRDAVRGVGIPDGRVPYATYWLIDNEQLIGVVRIRPQLTPSAERDGGHIGYDIAPAHRRKGYGAALLGLALIEARRLGLERVIVTCLASNIPSRRVIEKCGGRFIEVVDDDETGQPLNRYTLETSVAI